jgi:hypothetical protein
MQSNKKREELIQQGYVIDLPLAPKRNNSKKVRLTGEQRNMLQKEYGILTSPESTEESALKILRKRFKRYSFTKV